MREPVFFCAYHFDDVSKMINEKVNLKRFIVRIMYGTGRNKSTSSQKHQ